jgi:hypothetical protein
MSNQWFYIQQWNRNRWEHIGKELAFVDAHNVFKALNQMNDERNDPFPLALLAMGEDKDRKGKVITSKDEQGDWQVVIANAKYVFGDQPSVVEMVDPKEH